MKFSSTCIAVVSAFLPQLISAHLRITDPAPYNGENNSPLDASGANFPCLMDGAYPSVQATKTYTAGQMAEFKVVGGATHGGGSCQVSITYDNPPTKNSKFKVMHSWIGGCPVASNEQNLSGDRNDQTIPALQFNMTEGLHSGDATFVWTWFNRIGNREMYMNCAPIKVQGGNDQSTFNNLPDMFKANIGAQGECTTVEKQDIIFPDANIGDSVTVGKGACNFQPACSGKGTYSFKPGQPGDQAGVAAPGGGSSGSSGSSSGGSSSGGSSSGGSYSNGGSSSSGGSSSGGSSTGGYTTPSGPALVDSGNNGGAQSNSPPSSEYTSINGGGSSGSTPQQPAQPAPAQPSMPSYGGNQGSQPSTPVSPPATPPSTGGGSSYGGNASAPAADDNTGMQYGQQCGDGSAPVTCNGAPQGQFIECYGKNPNGQQMGWAKPLPAGFNGCQDYADKCGQNSSGQKFKRHAFEHAKRLSRRHAHI